ncbi:MAG: hypothetical protein RR565_04710 [Erysipelothrix sp.]
MIVYETAGYYELDPAILLDMTFYEIDLYTSQLNRCRKEKAEFDTKVEDSLNYTLGQYIGFAVNDPSKYPRKPFTQTEVQPTQKDMTAEEMVISLKAWMGVMGGKEVMKDG